MKATRHLIPLDEATRWIGFRYPATLLYLTRAHPEVIPSEAVDGHRYFAPSDLDDLSARFRAHDYPALEGR